MRADGKIAVLGIVFCVGLCSCEIGVKVAFVAFTSWCFCSGWRGVVVFIAVVIMIEAE